MLSFILLLVAGSAIAYLSKDNLTPVTLHVGSYSFSDIPLFFVIITAFITGLILAYLVHLVQAFFIARKLKSKQKKINKTEDEVHELTKRVHQLELENEKLKHLADEPADPNAL
jgi:lipopolysaccharide assembly protein A